MLESITNTRFARNNVRNCWNGLHDDRNRPTVREVSSTSKGIWIVEDLRCLLENLGFASPCKVVACEEVVEGDKKHNERPSEEDDI